MKTIVVKLDCHHSVETVPQVNWTTPVKCWRCVGMPLRHVVAVWQFCRVKCVTCQHYKGFRGWRAVESAKTATYKHSADHPSHIVQCWHGGERILTATLARTQTVLPLWELPAPF